MRVALLAAACVLTLTPPLVGQTPLRRERPKAFPVALTPSVHLSFGGVRAYHTDPLTCPQAGGARCSDYSVGSGPMAGAELQIPVASTFGLSVGAAVGRPPRIVCTRGAACNSRGHLTAIKGSALVLFRFKARAPIYFGIGGAMNQLSRGVVDAQTDAVSEFGAVGVIGYDFAIGQRFGARVAWWHFYTQSTSDQLGGDFEAAGITHDWTFSVGARIAVSP